MGGPLAPPHDEEEEEDEEENESVLTLSHVRALIIPAILHAMADITLVGMSIAISSEALVIWEESLVFLTAFLRYVCMDRIWNLGFFRGIFGGYFQFVAMAGITMAAAVYGIVAACSHEVVAKIAKKSRDGKSQSRGRQDLINRAANHH